MINYRLLRENLNAFDYGIGEFTKIAMNAERYLAGINLKNLVGSTLEKVVESFDIAESDILDMAFNDIKRLSNLQEDIEKKKLDDDLFLVECGHYKSAAFVSMPIGSCYPDEQSFNNRG